MEAKSIQQSKTVWINGIVLLVSIGILILQAVQGGNLPLWFDVDPELVALGLALLNIILRFVTRQPLSLR